MPYNVMPGWFLARLQWQWAAGQQADTLLSFDGTSAALPTATSLANALATHLNSASPPQKFEGVTSTKLTLASVVVDDRRAMPISQAIAVVGRVGVQATDPLPRQVALVTTFRTALIGRRYRGRVYNLGNVEGQSDANGEPIAGLAAAYDTIYTNLQAAMSAAVTGPWILSVASRGATAADVAAGRAPAAFAPGLHPVTQIQSHQRWNTQRRRLT